MVCDHDLLMRRASGEAAAGLRGAAPAGKHGSARGSEHEAEDLPHAAALRCRAGRRGYVSALGDPEASPSLTCLIYGDVMSDAKGAVMANEGRKFAKLYSPQSINVPAII